MTSLSNFGQTGPYRDYKMTEITAYALGGTMQNTGLAGREPLKLGLTVEQFFAGMITATATMGAYIESLASGTGQQVDLSMMEIMVANQDRAVQGHMIYRYTGAFGHRPRLVAQASGATSCPTGVYPTADGYVQFFTLQPHWERICNMIERARPDQRRALHRRRRTSAATRRSKLSSTRILLEWLLTPHQT